MALAAFALSCGASPRPPATGAPEAARVPAEVSLEFVALWWSESQMEGVQSEVNGRMARMSRNLDATLEHLRIGAVKGQILDSDGASVIYDLFTEFGVTQETVSCWRKKPEYAATIEAILSEARSERK